LKNLKEVGDRISEEVIIEAAAADIIREAISEAAEIRSPAEISEAAEIIENQIARRNIKNLVVTKKGWSVMITLFL